MTAPIGGPAYPTGAWQPGELVRSQMDIVFDGTDAQPLVEVAGETAALAPLPQRRP